MGLILWILIGALVGWLSSKVVGTDQDQGWIANIVLGIIGGVLGGAVSSFIFDDSFNIDWSIGSFLAALGGGIIVSAGYSALSRGR